jgi:effector-binding domain-containing protein
MMLTAGKLVSSRIGFSLKNANLLYIKNVYNRLINAIKEKNMKVISGIPNSNNGKNFIPL